MAPKHKSNKHITAVAHLPCKYGMIMQAEIAIQDHKSIKQTEMYVN
jgi:hypothetical protein